MAIGDNRRYPTAGSPLLVCQSARTSRGSGGFGGKGSGGGAGAGFGDGGIGDGFGLGPGVGGFGIGAELLTMLFRLSGNKQNVTTLATARSQTLTLILSLRERQMASSNYAMQPRVAHSNRHRITKSLNH
jgi:hypothetical protein